MKKIALLILMGMGCMGLKAQNSGNVTVNLTEIKKKDGQIVFMLFNGEDGFPREPAKAFKKGIVPKFSTEATYTFSDVPYGNYAIAVFQDLDKDGEIKSNFIGMPKEPVGASNMTKMGKPSYKKCAFDLESASKSIAMKFILN